MTNSIDHIELDEAQQVDNANLPTLVKRDMGLINHVLIELSVDLGSAKMPVEAFFNLKAGDVVKLLQQVNEPATLRLDGKAVARGELVAVDDNFGIQLTHIL